MRLGSKLFLSQNVTQCQLDPLPNKFIWNQEAINLYIQNSNSVESKNKLDVFLQSNFTDSDKTVESFNKHIIDNTASIICDAGMFAL
jgi:hypothetical protein